MHVVVHTGVERMTVADGFGIMALSWVIAAAMAFFGVLVLDRVTRRWHMGEAAFLIVGWLVMVSLLWAMVVVAIWTAVSLI